ncbi:MAG: sugar transferase [Candidatus Kapabacteria bacterium]|nr:sugar transferase [Candidatus Kapabacteria bacterium]
MLDKAENIKDLTLSKKNYLKLKSRLKPNYFLTPTFFQLVSDIIAIVITTLVQYYLRFETGIYSYPISFEPIYIFLMTFFLTGYWLLIFWFSGLYKNWYIRSPFDEFFTIIRATFFGSFLIMFLIFMDGSPSTRQLFLIYFALITFNVALGRFIIKRIQKFLREKRILFIPSIIIGSKEKALELYQKTENSPSWGYKVIGYISVENNGSIDLNNQNSLRYLGNINKLDELLDELLPQEVLITTDSPNRQFLLKIASICSEKNIIVKIVPDLYDIFMGQVRTLPVYGIPLIEITTEILKPWERIIKRFIDIIFSLLVLVLGIPLWILIAIIIKLESKGPILYKQERVGRHGKIFKMYKFRSMVQDAEKHGPQWAKVNDPRVTKFGYFLRKSHLDEIPQFINVLKGEMSIVGPRPERPVFVEKFSALIPYYKRRLIVRPGITGWWQVNYTTYVESVEEIENRLKDDFYYIENVSLKLDLEIIIRTIYLMIKGHGQT